MATAGTIQSTPALLNAPENTNEATPRKLLGRASVAGAGTIYQQCVAFASGMIIARVLGAADYGIFNLARSLVDTTSILTRAGLDIGLQRHLGETRLAADQAARLRVLHQLRLVTALLALLPVAAVGLGLGPALQTHVYQHAGFAQILLCVALMLPFLTDIGVLGGAYRGVLRPVPAILAESVLLPTARLLLIVLLFLAGWRLWAVAAGTTAGSVLAAAWLAWRARRDFPSRSAPGESWQAARRVIRYSSVMAAAVLVTTLTATMDILMLGRYVPAEQLGQYSLAKTLLLLIGFFAAAFNQGLGALVAERHRNGDREGMLHVMSLTFRWITIGTLPVFAVFLFWGTELMRLFGPSFIVPQGVVTWLALGQLVLALLGPMGWVLSMTGRHLIEFVILAAGLLLAIVLCAVAIPVWGPLGAAVSAFIAIAFTNGARILWVRRTLAAFPFDARVLLLLGGGVAMAFVSHWLSLRTGLDGFWRTALGIGLFASCYGAVGWRYLRGLHQEVKANAAG